MKSPRSVPLRPPPEPWEMPIVPTRVVYAFKALAAGKANEGQQKLLLSYLVFELCAITRNPFDPRKDKFDGRAVTDYTLGKQHVGRVIGWIVETPVKGAGDQEIPSEAGIEPQGTE